MQTSQPSADLSVETVAFNGWQNCLRLSNRDMELVVTTDVGPRVMRCAFKGQPNLLAEIDGQQGGAGEDEWMIRGGHRLWLAPEEKPATYELDNAPVQWSVERDMVCIDAPPGPLTGISKHLRIKLAADANRVELSHVLRNAGSRPRRLAPWALTVMAPGGCLVVPLPPKILHTDRLTHNQNWSVWGYTDFADGRWQFQRDYLLFSQTPVRGPGKIGMAHREGGVVCLQPGGVFVKRFDWQAGAEYPDGGVNFETFANEDFLEVESLGPLTTLAPGAEVVHGEVWELHARPRDTAPAALLELMRAGK